MAEQVLIEFVSDIAGLEPAVNQLEQLGKIDKATADQFRKTNAELKTRQATIQKNAAVNTQAATSTKKSIDDVDKAVKNLTNDFVQGFQEGVNDALKEAGVSASEFSEALKNGNTEVEKSSQTVRARMREIVQELAKMRASGEEATNPERYRELTVEAGNLRDALSDVGDEINRAGSDTQVFDSLLNVAQGVTGGFAAAQGAIGLFADESEELQEVLLRVNSAMALLQGLQQVQEVLSKRIAIARGLETVATNIQTAATTVFNVVVGASTGLMRAFRIALASTGIGLLVIALVELVSWLAKENNEVEEANRLLERNKNIVEADTEAIKNLTDEYIASAEARNALESELITLRGKALQSEKAVLEESNARLVKQMGLVDSTSEAWFLLNKQVEENNSSLSKINSQLTNEGRNRDKALAKERLESQIATTERALLLAKEGSAAQLALQQKLVRDKLELDLGTQALTEAQKLLLIEQANKEQLELQMAFQRRGQALDIQRVEEQLKTVEEGSNAELKLRSELIRKQAAMETNTTKLSEAEKMQIREAAAKEILGLEVAYEKEIQRVKRESAIKVREEYLQAAITRNATELALTKEGTEENLQLQLVGIELAAAQERQAAIDNALEIARINAVAEQQKLAIRKQFSDRALEYEIEIEQSKNGSQRRLLEKTVANEREAVSKRINAIVRLTDIEIAEINKRIEATKVQYYQGLISLEEYNRIYLKLVDDRKKAEEKANTDIENMTKARLNRQIQTSLDVTNQLVGVLDSLFQAQSDRELQRIDEQRARVDELLETGAITEKEAQARRKKLEIEERQAQQRAAQRDKQIAVFKAILAIPQAFLQGLVTGGPIVGAIYAAIAAAQAAIVISKPIPKFGKGKKNNYQGLAEIGETGAELVEKNGKMFIAPKKTIVWLGAKDKVFNPTETAAMLEKRHLRAAKLPDNINVSNNQLTNIDYEAIGKSVAKHTPKFGLNLDNKGFTEWVAKANEFTKYLDNRRGF